MLLSGALFVRLNQVAIALALGMKPHVRKKMEAIGVVLHALHGVEVGHLGVEDDQNHYTSIKIPRDLY